MSHVAAAFRGLDNYGSREKLPWLKPRHSQTGACTLPALTFHQAEQKLELLDKARSMLGAWEVVLPPRAGQVAHHQNLT